MEPPSRFRWQALLFHGAHHCHPLAGAPFANDAHGFRVMASSATITSGKANIQNAPPLVATKTLALPFVKCISSRSVPLPCNGNRTRFDKSRNRINPGAFRKTPALAQDETGQHLGNGRKTFRRLTPHHPLLKVVGLNVGIRDTAGSDELALIVR